jgi:hypothetical protein
MTLLPFLAFTFGTGILAWFGRARPRVAAGIGLTGLLGALIADRQGHGDLRTDRLAILHLLALRAEEDTVVLLLLDLELCLPETIGHQAGLVAELEDALEKTGIALGQDALNAALGHAHATGEGRYAP